MSHGIRLSGPRLGCLKSDPELLAEEKRQFLDDQRWHNPVDGKIGQSEYRCGLGLIRAKLAVTGRSCIALNMLMMNLEKLLELLFVFLTSLLCLLLVNKSDLSSSAYLQLQPQISAA